ASARGFFFFRPSGPRVGRIPFYTEIAMKLVGCLLFAASVISLVRTAPAPSLAAAPPLQSEDDGATVTGRVKIKGDSPKRRKISTNADPKCSAMHPGDLFTDDFVIDPAGNVQFALVSVKEGLGARKFPAPKTPVIVEQKGCRFEPHVL